MNSDTDEGFRAFVVGRWPRMLRTAYLLTGNHHDAEELVQTALARAYAKWGRVLRSDDADAYVWQIMVHANADRFRRRRIREWVTHRLPETPVADRTGQVEEHRSLMEALGRLSARQRSVLVLRYFEDMTHRQIAGLLGTREATVRSQITRGLARLRQDHALAGRRADVPAAAGSRGGAGVRAAAPEEAGSR
ncbi:SigE family RNA polymerase sigma factor [Streptomyces sp. HB2AG]|uniref:SigE family RNA polymerase sigma factor n=1 Tax=Streptomyces sp. HB2AG TaxID=2983400 RepID=UPI0022AB4AC9|nr:SigE family RNA polymerase sigma factor [Streptomyces sp. HB2AG]MCZ2523975.1 SigE family RNA polymerase sigma factor [Streptomyces sp. HB2AG]